MMVLASMAVVVAQGQLGALKIDTSRSAIALDAILSGGPPPQGIPALGFSGDWQQVAPETTAPGFVTPQEASTWLADNEPVIVVSLNNETKLYPLQILTWHEIVNDTLAGVPVAVTFCPLCNSALAFDRRIPLNDALQADVMALNENAVFEEVPATFYDAYAQQHDASNITAVLPVTFGVSGLLHNSNMLMFDTASSTLWTQLLGSGAVGTLTGTQLLRYPAQIASFQEATTAFPNAPVLSRNTGFNRNYGRNPYVGYDDINSPAFLFDGTNDPRLAPKTRVISIDLPAEAAAYPFEVLEATSVVNDMVASVPVVLFWQAGTASALDASVIADSKDVGSVGVFERTVNGEDLSFEFDGEFFVDEQTGSRWTVFGQAISGALSGHSLTPVVHDNTLWFAWAAFRPDTRIYRTP